MPWSVAAAAITAYYQYQASKDAAEAAETAADTMAESQDEWTDYLKSMYADYKPFMMAGLKGYKGLLEDPEAYKESPGYQFRLQEGLKSVGIADGEVNQRNLTGSQLKAITGYTQDYATSDYDRALQRYAGMAGISTGVFTAAGDFGMGMAGYNMQGSSQQAYYDQMAANMRAAGQMGMGTTLANLFSQYGDSSQTSSAEVE